MERKCIRGGVGTDWEIRASTTLRRRRAQGRYKLPAVWRAGRWAWVVTLACSGVVTLACSGAPSSDADERDANREHIETLHAGPSTGPSTRVDDPLLASGREQMRDGRVPDAVHEQLLASRDPDHRHAVRLLQAVAGETPAAVLSRAAGEAEREIVQAPRDPQVVESEPVEPMPNEPMPSEPALAPAESDPADDLRLDPLPKLADVPSQSPLRAWLAGESPIEPDPPPASIELPIERLRGPELLLLRERPPRSPNTDGPEGGLVILTSMSLLPGPDASELVLVLAGSGPARVLVQPLDEHRVRLTVADAGAVPSFLAARPGGPEAGQGLTILDVARREQDVELELALAAGLRLVAVEQLGNGATVKFSRSDTLPPS
jgi:hypothetical protein